MDLALNNVQWLICHKTKPNQTKPIRCQAINLTLQSLGGKASWDQAIINHSRAKQEGKK